MERALRFIALALLLAAPFVAQAPDGLLTGWRAPPFVRFPAAAGRPDRFVWRAPGAVASLTRTGIDVSAVASGDEHALAATVSIHFDGIAAAAGPEPLGEGRESSLHHFFMGADAAQWRTDCPSFARVRWPDVWPGIDVVACVRDGRLCYDLRCRAGADLSRVRMRADGLDPLVIDANGDLLGRAPIGPFRQTAPRATVAIGGGERRPVPCRFLLHGTSTWGFAADAPAGADLEIDPGLVFASWIGGASPDGLASVAVEASGAILVAGRTLSTSLPGTPGVFDPTNNGGFDAFVAKISANGATLQWCSYLGGNGTDAAQAVAIDSSGRIVLAGRAGTGFPMGAHAFDGNYHGFGDAFVACLSPSGASLMASTYIGGAGDDRIMAVAIGPADEPVVAGMSQSLSGSFPLTPGTYASPILGGWDGFVARFDPALSQLWWAARLGGSADDRAFGVTVLPDGRVACAGTTASADLAVSANAFDSSFNGQTDAFVAVLSAAGDTLDYASFFGGPDADQAIGIASDETGTALLVCGGAGPGFPVTPGALRTTVVSSDAFVLRLDLLSGAPAFSTLLGGVSTEMATAVAFDPGGHACVVGWTNSPDFSTTPFCFDPTFNGGSSPGDAFVVKLAMDGHALAYGTFFGGSSYDEADAMAPDGAGGVVICGATGSTTFPGPLGGAGNAPHGLDDGFVARLTLPANAQATILGTGCGHLPPPGMTVNDPMIGYAVVAAGVAAPPGVPGFLLVSASAPATALPAGCVAWVDPVSLTVLAPLNSAADGSWTFSAPPIADSPVLNGLHLRSQAVFPIAGGASPFALTNGIDLIIAY